MKCITLALAAVVSQSSANEEASPTYTPPSTVAGAHFFEPFISQYGAFEVSKDADIEGQWEHELHQHDGLAGDMGLVVSSPAQKHAVSTVFTSPFVPKEQGGLVIQYELQLKQKLQCGGAYLKLLTASDKLDHDGFHSDTPYTIMFGPDHCGGTKKVHFILRHKNPVNGEWEEKHMVGPPSPDVKDGLTHLYTAIVGDDSSVTILVDNKKVKETSLLSASDFKPAVNPEKIIDDPEDKKPEGWVDDPKVDDPMASKPEEWDEAAPLKITDPDAVKPLLWQDDGPLKVPDPSATPPDDWDIEEDGVWEAPLVDNSDCHGEGKGCGEWEAPEITNPSYKGTWHAPRIDNPAYLGVWKPKQIDNPVYFTDEAPWAMAPVGGIGIELWTMQSGILFDNILLTGSADVAAGIAASAFEVRSAAEKAAKKKDMEQEDGLGGMVKLYAARAFDYCKDNATLVGATLCLGVLPLLLFCFGRKKKPSTPASAAAASSSEPGPSSAGAASNGTPDANDDEPISKKAAGKKRTPKAS